MLLNLILANFSHFLRILSLLPDIFHQFPDYCCRKGFYYLYFVTRLIGIVNKTIKK